MNGGTGKGLSRKAPNGNTRTHQGKEVEKAPWTAGTSENKRTTSNTGLKRTRCARRLALTLGQEKGKDQFNGTLIHSLGAG